MPITAPPAPESWLAVWSASTLVAQRIAPILGAEHDLDAVARPRRLQAVNAEVTVDDAVVDFLADAAGLDAGRLQVVELGLGDAVRDERIPGHAVQVAAIHDRAAGRHAADVDDVQRILHAADDEVVERRRVHRGRRVLHRSVVAPGLVDRPAHASHDAERGVRERLLPSAALDVAPQDVHRDDRARGDLGGTAADRREACPAGTGGCRS